ncbi:MAG: triose-phosphate isomerase [Bacteroidetes bacterium]|jgi:triosephosphate isomerase|nr:triose-phosphate isomerase [Bacteroidota bacterium]
MLIAGNWKMHTDLSAAQVLARNVAAAVAERGAALDDVDLAVCPPFISLEAVRDELADTDVAVGAQNMHFADEGAYTGEVSAPMLHSVGCRYVILGHSERRQYFGEDDAGVNSKVQQAVDHKLIPIVCVGETKAQRDGGDAEAVVRTQVRGALKEVPIEGAEQLVVAYEPVWAIGTGDTATPEQAEAMHAFIEEVLAGLYGEEMAPDIEVLYGGSMKPHNARSLLEQPHIDGGLIGGASLRAEDFLGIADAAVTATKGPIA